MNGDLTEWAGLDLDHMRELLAKWVDEGDRITVTELRRDLLRLIEAARELVGDVDTALLDWAADGPLEVAGKRYRRMKDGRTVWTGARDLLAAVLAAHGVDSPAVIHDLLAVMPGTPMFRVGKPGEVGVRSLGLNPDDYSEYQHNGWRLEVKELPQ